MKNKYLVVANVEHQGAILNITYETSDEAQAINYFNDLEDYYMETTTKIITIGKWNGETFHQIKIAV